LQKLIRTIEFAQVA